MDDDSLDAEHVIPQGVSAEVVDALGKISEALETIEHARGSLYAFHRLTGSADLALGEAVDLLRRAGQPDLAEQLETELVGRNVIEGRWTFQVVEDYDDTYYGPIKAWEAGVRDRLVGGRRHLFEARMKQQRRSRGRRHHEAMPPEREEPQG